MSSDSGRAGEVESVLPYRAVIRHLLDGDVPHDGHWYGTDEDHCPMYRGASLTEGERRVLEDADVQ